MMYEEFNKISGKCADLGSYQNEIEPIYLEFDQLTKKEVAALYWGLRKGAYDIYLQMKDLMRYIKELKAIPFDRFGLVEHMASVKIQEMKFELIEKVKALKIA